MSKEQEPVKEVQLPETEGIIKVSAFRKLTFKRGSDFDSLQGTFEFLETRAHALESFRQKLEELDKTLTEEKRRTLEEAGLLPNPATPTPSATPAPTPQQASTGTGDPYSTLPWKQSAKDSRLSTIRVSEKLSPQACELHQRLKAADKHYIRLGNITYHLSVTTKDYEYVARGTEYLQRWGS
jgi:hypothetical protein